MLIRPLIVLLLFSLSAVADEPKSVEFHLTYDQEKLGQPFTGRVFVLLTRSEPRGVPRSINWFNPEPAFALDVQKWKPGEIAVINDKALAYPTPLKDIRPGKYYAVAAMDRDLGGDSFAASPGNLYSKPVQFEVGTEKPAAIRLKLDQLAQDSEFKETDTVKLAEIESPLLTKFHGRSTKLRAGVILPPSFATNKEKHYPIVYEIPGFGGDHRMAFGIASRKPWDVAGVEMIWVVLDARCRLGHHVFADSDNNGPAGTALVQELIPFIEKKFRGIPNPGARFVTGHSSGGWSSLWLQVAYPDFFGGCWSTSPDPVDFRDFQRVNIYDPKQNLFSDAEGKPRSLSRPSGGRQLQYRTFSDMEVLMGRGGQLGSFEAVFSKRGSDGQPEKLWNRKSGVIDPAVAKSWEKYDINLKVQREWKTLGPKLKGKVHVYMGELDTFYLEGATKLLKETMAKLNSDAVIELFPNKTHSLIDAKLRMRMNEEIAAAFRSALAHKSDQ